MNEERLFEASRRTPGRPTLIRPSRTTSTRSCSGRCVEPGDASGGCSWPRRCSWPCRLAQRLSWDRPCQAARPVGWLGGPFCLRSRWRYVRGGLGRHERYPGRAPRATRPRVWRLRGGWGSMWSPDGRYLAYRSLCKGTGTVYLSDRKAIRHVLPGLGLAHRVVPRLDPPCHLGRAVREHWHLRDRRRAPGAAHLAR